MLVNRVSKSFGLSQVLRFELYKPSSSHHQQLQPILFMSVKIVPRKNHVVIILYVARSPQMHIRAYICTKPNKNARP